MNDQKQTKGESATKAFFKSTVLGVCGGVVVGCGAVVACIYFNMANK